jgi:elongation factor P--(R)-beta-lysine ligase
MFQESLVNSLKIGLLRDRASMLKEARSFFQERQVTEVDCPILSPKASVDAHIDLIPAFYGQKEECYLHSSPEFGMKRLLAEGMEDIYQLSHVFRDGEWGSKHNPEFMMAEWYRLGFSLETMIDETVAFIRLFLGPHPYRVSSYRQVFHDYAGIDYLSLNEQELMSFIEEKGIPAYPSLLSEGKDAMLNLILGSLIEPQLGQKELFVLAYYPASQAALAKKRWVDSEQVAERFEVYFKGVELANGYHELTDPVEQRHRFEEANQMRVKLGKKPLPIDERFLKALEKGLPDCCGVAIGFDRLMMLRHDQTDISKVLAWGWQEV